MRRLLLALLLCLVTAATARAHFVFVVPEPGGGVAYVILSEDLDPDEEVPIRIISGIELHMRDADGRDVPLDKHMQDFAFRVDYPAGEAQLLHGALELGTHQGGDNPTYLVSYYPKAILGDAFAPAARVGDELPVEIVPVGRPGDVRFLVLLRGEPLPGAEVTVYLPDGGRRIVHTDEQGLTEAYAQAGRYGAWARGTLGGPGTHEGEDYAEARGYASLVARIGEPEVAVAVARSAADASAAESPADAAPSDALLTRRFLDLPQPTSSFGAAEADGYLYVYGGHIANTHDYDTQAVSGRFARIDLDAGSVWEKLPPGPGLQGMNLAAHHGMVYRAGGMQPRNARGTPQDNYSVADCARFNPASMQWEWLTPMPEGRSSHDLIVVDDTLYVIGGWNMLGAEEGVVWPEEMFTLDLSDPLAAWRRVEQPFARRALIVAEHEGRIWIMGGMDDLDEVSRRVDVYDPSTGQWSRGPDLAGEHDVAGFASAACVLDGRLYASVAGGELMRLTQDGSAWEIVGRHTPRIVHRLVPWRGEIYAVGGADKGRNSDLVEVLTPPGSTGFAEDRPRVRAVPTVSAPPSTPRAPAASRAPADAPEATVTAPTAVSRAAPASGAVQTFCPVMTNAEVVDEFDTIRVEYAGREVLLCCSKCAKKWEADPAAYASLDVLPQLAGVELPERTLTQRFCPVYPTRVVSESDPFVIYEGKKIHLFNSTAVRRFEEDPARYLDPAILPQLAE